MKHACPICDGVGPLERHHLLPKAMGGRTKRNILRICRPCHVTLHRVHGPGNDYRGPVDADELIASLRDLIDVE